MAKSRYGCIFSANFREFIGNSSLPVTMVGMSERKDTRTETRQEDKLRHWRHWQPRWKQTRWQVIWAVGTVVALVTTIALLIVYLDAVKWDGLSNERKEQLALLIGIAVAVTTLIVLLAIGGATLRWTGFSGKTLWDWLQILSALAIPIVLASAGFWFAAQQDQRQQRAEALRAESEQKLTEQRAQAAALQSYLSQMSSLMLNRDLLKREMGDPAYILAQARTSTVITRLDAAHNKNVTRFLSDSGLTGTTPLGETSISIFRGIDLSGADLRGASLVNADLSDANLTDVELSDTLLSKVDLSSATLTDANLSDAILIEADLSSSIVYAADLSDAHLSRANLRGAILTSWAARSDAMGVSDELARINVKALISADTTDAPDLSGADLRGADLRQAFLRGADLSGAQLGGASLANADLSDVDVTQDQLSDSVDLYGTTMPNGQKYKDWLTGHPDFPDSDSDGVPDNAEKTFDLGDPNNPDTDGDGLQDGADANPNNPDTDGDGVQDGADANLNSDGATDGRTASDDGA